MLRAKNSFADIDKSDAENAFSLWQSRMHESIDEYTMRKRKAELYALVRKVIKNELDPEQQELVRLHWYEGKSLSEISVILGLDRSTVSRREKKINDIIYDKLKYAMEYRYGKEFSQGTSAIIKTNRFACCPVESKSIAQRLKNLRLRQGINEEAVFAATGIGKNRLAALEEKGDDLNVTELTKLSKLYSATTDYIIFGKAPVYTKGEILNENDT